MVNRDGDEVCVWCEYPITGKRTHVKRGDTMVYMHHVCRREQRAVVEEAAQFLEDIRTS